MKEREVTATMHDPLFGGSQALVTAAHELKSPLALIRQIALEIEVNPAKSDELLAQIVHLSERSLRLTSDLTKASRLNGELFVDVEPVNSVALCEEVAHEIFPLYKAHERRIEVVKRRQAPLVVANRELLRRILLGFADNALHYADGSSKTLLQVLQQGDHVHVGVRDTGPVLDAATLKRVTEHMTVMTGRPESSGLGLAIASKFAQAMRASIGTTRHRDGMTFYVQTLPSVQLSLL